MPISVLDSTMSMLDISPRKNAQCLYIAFNCESPDSPFCAMNCFTALPKPNQPGNKVRFKLQLNTQGIARKSSMRFEGLRDEGRLPILSSAISRIGVEVKK